MERRDRAGRRSHFEIRKIVSDCIGISHERIKNTMLCLTFKCNLKLSRFWDKKILGVNLVSTRLFDDLIPPMRRNRKSLRGAQESQSLFDRRDESTRIVHRRELGSYASHGFCEQSQREVARKKQVAGVDFSCTRDRETHKKRIRICFAWRMSGAANSFGGS